MAETESGKVVRWDELPKQIQFALDRTPRNLWYRIRPFFVQSSDTHRVLDLARLVDQILPRSTVGLQRRMTSADERARKVGEVIQNLDAFWTAVDAVEASLERIARSAGVWDLLQNHKNKKKAATSPPKAIPASGATAVA